jgi:hypothetical protein
MSAAPDAAARQIIADATEALRARGYSVRTLAPPGRHFLGRIERDGRSYFFKMSGCPELATHVRNEAAWNRLVSSRIDPALAIVVPPVRAAGELGELFWMVCDLLPAEPLARRADLHAGRQKIAAAIERLADCLWWTGSLGPFELPMSATVAAPDRVGQTLAERARHWHTTLGRGDEELLRILDRQAPYLQAQTQHGDLAPPNVIPLADGTVGLVDAEFAAATWPRYFDAALLFARLATVFGALDLARHLLARFRDRLDAGARVSLIDEIRPALAERTIAAYFDAVTSSALRTSDFLWHEELARAVVDGRLLPQDG